MNKCVIDQIPVIYIEPQGAVDRRLLVIWLSGLSGTKESNIAYLEDLANAGFVALSFDTWQHGERGNETSQQIGARVFDQFRRQMWPILGQTVLDTTRVIDWAIRKLDVLPEVYMGGISMGGDISVAAAGFDHRITRVAAMVATPDWTRPGMRDLFNPEQLLEQGAEDTYARFFYDRFNPLTHLSAYAHGPEITFECAAEDTHVPTDGALRFHAALKRDFPLAGNRVRVDLIPDCGHMDSKKPIFWQNCLEWFKNPRPDVHPGFC